MKVYNALLVKNTYMLPLLKAALNLLLNNMKTILNLIMAVRGNVPYAQIKIRMGQVITFTYTLIIHLHI